MNDNHPPNKSQPREFDENKSQAAMPRLYEHIDRVDLWIMAQRQQFNADQSVIEALQAENQRLSQQECPNCGTWLVQEDVLKKYHDKYFETLQAENLALQTKLKEANQHWMTIDQGRCEHCKHEFTVVE